MYCLWSILKYNFFVCAYITYEYLSFCWFSLLICHITAFIRMDFEVFYLFMAVAFLQSFFFLYKWGASFGLPNDTPQTNRQIFIVDIKYEQSPNSHVNQIINIHTARLLNITLLGLMEVDGVLCLRRTCVWLVYVDTWHDNNLCEYFVRTLWQGKENTAEGRGCVCVCAAIILYVLK